MSNDNSTTRGTLIALALVVLFFGSIAAYYLLQPAQATVTALFAVSSNPSDVLVDSQPISEREQEIFRRTQIAYLKSYFVAQAALRAPGVGTLSILPADEDKADWLIEHLELSFQDDSEILEIKLTGPADQVEDLRQLVDAVCDAYVNETVFKSEQRRLVYLDAKQSALDTLRKRIEETSLELEAVNSDTPSDRAARALAQSDLDALQFVYRQLMVQLETEALHSLAPDRIRLIQTATIEMD